MFGSFVSGSKVPNVAVSNGFLACETSIQWDYYGRVHLTKHNVADRTSKDIIITASLAVLLTVIFQIRRVFLVRQGLHTGNKLEPFSQKPLTPVTSKRV